MSDDFKKGLIEGMALQPLCVEGTEDTNDLPYIIGNAQKTDGVITSILIGNEGDFTTVADLAEQLEAALSENLGWEKSGDYLITDMGFSLKVYGAASAYGNLLVTAYNSSGGSLSSGNSFRVPLPLASYLGFFRTKRETGFCVYYITSGGHCYLNTVMAFVKYTDEITNVISGRYILSSDSTSTRVLTPRCSVMEPGTATMGFPCYDTNGERISNLFSLMCLDAAVVGETPYTDFYDFKTNSMPSLGMCWGSFTLNGKSFVAINGRALAIS